MKLTKAAAVLGMTLLICTSANAGDRTSEALAACEAHVKAQHAGDVRQKIKRIKTRSSGVIVQLKVTDEVETYSAECIYRNADELAFTSDRTVDQVIARE